MKLNRMEIKMRTKVKTTKGVWRNTLSRKDKKRYIKCFGIKAFYAVSLSNYIDYEECNIINKFNFELPY
jgi:hypothetical protein